MEDLKEKTIDLADHVEGLTDTFYKLTMLNVTQKATNVVSNVIMMFVMLTLGVFIVLFAGCALALWLGDLIGSRAGGFLLAAGIFLLLMVVIGLLRKKTIFPMIRDMIIRKVYD